MDGTAQIVIVEDDAQIRRFVRTSLETDSYRVSEAETQSRGAIEAGTLMNGLGRVRRFLC